MYELGPDKGKPAVFRTLSISLAQTKASDKLIDMDIGTVFAAWPLVQRRI